MFGKNYSICLCKTLMRKSRYGVYKRGLNTKIDLVVDSSGKPICCTVTSGTIADSSQACNLLSKVPAQYLLADRGYDTNAIIQEATSRKMEVVIPLKKNCKVQREYSYAIYEYRHKIENTFLELKCWRGIATNDIFVHSSCTKLLYVSLASY